jgi:hypothetical protein
MQEGTVGAQQHLPGAGLLERRQHKRDRLELGIQDEEHGIAVAAFLAGRPLLDGLSSQEQPDTAALGGFLVLGEHF